MREKRSVGKKVFSVLIVFAVMIGCKESSDDEGGDSFKLTFDKNAADATGTMTALAITPGTAVTLTANAFSRNGWNFQGWAATAAGNAIYADKASYTPGEADVTLYAKWKTWTKLVGATIDSVNTLIALDSSDNCYIAGKATSSVDDQVISGTKDAFVVKYDAKGVRQWTRLVGANPSSTFNVTGIAVDANGNCCVTGYTDAAFDGETLTGQRDTFLVKYDSSGNKVWTRMLGAPSNKITYAFGVGTDAAGKWYVAGHTTGNLPGAALNANTGLFIAKYASDGTFVWAKILEGSAGTDLTYGFGGIATDAAGNSVVAGKTECALNGQAYSGASGDAFAAKYDASGNLIWARLLGSGVSGKNTQANRVALDSSGNSYVTGWTQAGIGGQTLTGYPDAFVAKYDSSGNLQWTRLLGVSGAATTGYGVAADSNGASYVTGDTFGALDGNSLSGWGDAFLAKYDSAGNKQWTRLLGATGSTSATTGYGIVLDSSGDCYVSGEIDSYETTAYTFDGIALGSAAAKSSFVTTAFNQ